ncbi:hypothetical protein Nepgr_016097 [Nepenthes gracilis]|uniref:Myb-like domain-containing protein n=1 Tax=Nepenthes gracilis TaxID=150966 RepID=A0AAD3SPU7_NEPGR|nr:hypothetical protein Nepgr_016097 [Nepenthes gracilis]
MFILSRDRMDEVEDDSCYPQYSYSVKNQPQSTENHCAIEGEEDEDDGWGEEKDEENGIHGVGIVDKGSFDDDEDDEPDDRTLGMGRHLKKIKLRSLISSYEFVPRVPATAAFARSSFVGRNSLAEWTEHETFVLMEAWGDRLLQLGRKSLQSEEWKQVAEKVSRESKTRRTDTQCRNRLDTLKKKYKKEKAGIISGSSKWVYFKKMDILMSSMVSLKPSMGEEVDSDGLPPKRKSKERKTTFHLIVDSIQEFSEIYERIESNKREKMEELEKMRINFQEEMEMRRRKLMDKARAEIEKIRRGDDEEKEISAENLSL